MTKKTNRAKRNTTARSRRAKAPVAEPAGEAVRLARIPKGKRPQYFADPATDKLLAMTLSLMEELSVTRDRLATLERLLVRHRVLAADAVDAYQPDAAEEQRRERSRSEYIARVLRILQAELDEATRPDGPRSEADVIAAVID